MSSLHSAVLAVIGLALLFPSAPACAQPCATPTPAPADKTTEKIEEAIELRVGEPKWLPFNKLVRFSIRDSDRLQVKKIDGDTVSIVGIAPGETWIEFIHGARQCSGVRVRILPVEPTSQTPRDPGSEPRLAAPPTPEIPNRLRQPDVSVSIDPTFGFDSQHIFVTDSGFARSDTLRGSFQVVPLTLNYSPDSENRLMFQIPYVSRTQQTLTASGTKASISDQGLGDIRLGYEHTFPSAVFEWDVGLGVTTSLPTGKSPYLLSPSELPLGIGHPEIGLNFCFSRILDPVALRFSAGLDYTLPRTVLGQKVSPGLGYNLESLVTYALNDQWTLSEQLLFCRKPNVFLLNPADPVVQTLDQAYITHSLSYSPEKDFLIRFLLSVGLNDVSTDYIIGISAQWSR